MKKIRVLSIFLLAICLSLVFAGCKETSKYDIKEVKNAKNVVINKKETKVSFDVDNIVSEFNPSNIVISKAKAIVYTDKDCSKEAEVPLKLVEGKNKFYFRVILDKGNKLLKKTVWELNINRLKKVEGIEYELYSFEKLYNVGDSFKGGRIKKTVNGNETYIEITEDMVTGFTTSKEGKYQVIIKYEGQTFNIEITVYPKGQLLIPDYPVITPSELNVDDIYRELAIMIVKIDNGEVSDDKLEDLIKEVLKDSDLENYCFVLSRAFKGAGLTKTQVEQVINHVLKCFDGYDPENSNFIDAIVDMISRIISVFYDVDTIISEEQIGQIIFTAYKNNQQWYLRLQPIIESLKENPKYEAMIKTIQDTDQVLMSRNEIMYIGIAGYQELKEISKVIKNDMATITGVIEIVNNYMESGTLEINEEFITSLNKVGEIIDGLFQKVGKNTLNTCLTIVSTMLGKGFGDVQEYFEKLNIIEIVRNIDPAVKIVTNYLKNIKLEDKDDIEETLNAIMLITDLDNSSLTNETKTVLGHSLVVVSKILSTEISKLSTAEKLQLNNLLNILCENDGNNISSTAVFTLITKLANVDLSKTTDEDLISYVDELQGIMKPTQKLGYNLEDEIIVKQNTTKEEFVEQFKDIIKLYKYTLNTNGEYDSQDIELTANLLTIFDTSMVGAKLLEVTIDNMTMSIAYFVEGVEHDYVISPGELNLITDLFVYDLNNNVYPNRWFNYTVTIVDMLTGYAYSVELDTAKLKIENPDISTVGIKMGILTMDLDEYGIYYLPIEYYVIDLENPVVTDYKVDFNDELFVGKDIPATGQIAVEYNYRINVETLEETGKLVWQYNYSQYLSFDETNITGLDKNKEGTQNVTITVNGYNFETEIYVHPLSDAKKIKSVAFSMPYNYAENKDFKDQLIIYIVCVDDEYSIQSLTYKNALEKIKEYDLPFEITFEPLGEVKLGSNTFKLMVRDTLHNETFTFEDTVNIIEKEKFLALSNIHVTLSEYNLLLTDETDDDILRLITRITFYGSYYSGYLVDDEAYKWAKENIEVVRNVAENMIIFRSHGTEYTIYNVFFGLSIYNSTLEFYNNDAALPEFVNDFSDEDLFNGIVANIRFNNNLIVNSNSINMYQKYHSYIDIVREDDQIVFSIGGEQVKTFTILKSSDYTVYFNYTLKSDARLNIDDLNGTIINQLITVNFRAETSSTIINLYLDNKAITDSVLNYITFENVPTEVGEHPLQISFKGVSATKMATWYSNATAKNVLDLELFISGVLYKDTKKLDDLINYMHLLVVNYNDGTSKQLTKAECRDFLTKECTVTITDDEVKIVHNASGIEKVYSNTSDIKWYEISTVTVSDKTSISVIRTTENGVYKYRYQVYFYFSTPDQTDVSFIATGDAGKYMAIELFELEYDETAGQQTFTYVVNGNTIKGKVDQ